MNSKERRFKLKTTVDNFIIDTLVVRLPFQFQVNSLLYEPKHLIQKKNKNKNKNKLNIIKDNQHFC